MGYWKSGDAIMAFTDIETQTGQGGTVLEQLASLGKGMKVVVKTGKGDLRYGVCYNVDIEGPSFEIYLYDKTGASLDARSVISFDSLKALFFVKQFDGRTGTQQQIVATPPAVPVAVEFLDGEILIGRPLASTYQSARRAFFKPEDADTNNLLVLVERSAVKEFYSVEEHKRRVQQEFRAFTQKNFLPGESQEECLGDYYFALRNYFRAADHFRLAFENSPANPKITYKLCTANYNMAVRHIKQKDYPEALRCMEFILSLDPGFADAHEKAKKLRERLRVRESLEDAHSHLPDSVDSIQMQRFLDSRWIWQHHHFILTGPAHSGKTRIACSLGHKVSKKGLHVLYHRVPNLVNELQAARRTRTDIQMLVAMGKADFLIFDDWKHDAIPQEEFQLLREVVTARYLRRATLFISDLPRGQWHLLFGERIAADPVLYKVLNDAHKIHLGEQV